MIKKILALVLIILVLMSGCKNSDYLEPEKRSIITAVYIYGKSEEFSVILETVEIVTDNGETAYKPLYLSGSGESINNAINNAQLNFSKEFSLYHCPLIICENNLFQLESEKIFNEILKNSQISLAANFLIANNFLTQIYKKSDDEFLGYEITDAVELKGIKTDLISILNYGTNPMELIVDINNNYNVAENGNA